MKKIECFSQSQGLIFQRLALGIVKYRRFIIGACIVLLITAGIFGTGVIRRLSLARFEVEGSESRQVAAILQERFGTGTPNLVLLVEAKKGTVDDPIVKQQVLALISRLAKEKNAVDISSYWSRPFAPLLKSRNGKQALVLARLTGNVTDVRKQLARLAPDLSSENDVIRVSVGGMDEIFRQVGAQSQKDFLLADAIAIPLILLLLILVFRNVPAALLTLGTTIFSILLTMLMLRGLVAFIEVSTFALNLTMVLGLGVSVDYCLLIISRFREEFGKTLNVHTALVVTLQTAGKTVLFSAFTVAVSLSVLLIFPFFFLRSFAYAGIAVIGSGALAAIIVIPAFLIVLKHRIVAWGWWKPCVRKDDGFWYKVARLVMKHPLTIGVTAIALLLLLGSPFLRLQFGAPDERVLPSTAPGRLVQDEIRKNFTAEETDATQVLMGKEMLNRQKQTLENYIMILSKEKGVAQVDAFTGSYINGMLAARPTAWNSRFISDTVTWISVVPAEEQLNTNSFDLVKRIRSVKAPGNVKLGGSPASFLDYQNVLLSYIPLVVGIIMGITFILLYLMTGSLVIPLKAILLNMLSLSVSFGALVWIFQEGHLSGFLQFTATGSLETSIPILMFCLAFGLSMDYEVFIISRIKEEYDQTGDNMLSVAKGLEKSASLVTTAAALLSIAFIAFSTSGITLLKMMGVGMTIAVLIDATIIRALLMPAFMKLMGDANWWPMHKRS